MEKFDHYFQETSSAITGLSFIVIGAILFFLNHHFYFLVVDIFIFIFLLLGIKDFILYFLKHEKNNKDFIHSFVHLLFALFLSSYPNIPYSFLPWLIGMYFILNGALQLIDLLILIKNKSKGKYTKTIYLLFYIVTGLFLIVYPLKNISLFLKIIGLYFIGIGIRFVWDALLMIIPTHYKNSLKRKIRISLPVVIECLIPYAVLNAINETLQVGKDTMVYESKKNLQNPDLEVIIHVSPNGFNRLGHVDIHFNNEVISYGNYDQSSTKHKELFGDGVIFITKKEKYIPFCIEHSKKTLFVFGLTLNEQQKKRIQKEIQEIKKDLVEWSPPLKVAMKKKNRNYDTYTDYSSCLYRKTKAKFYKVQKGKFKTYFVLGNNCCLLADQIIGKSGIDLLKMNGIITPGSYYEYLNREFMRKGSFVVSRNIYNEKRKRNTNERKYFKSKRKEHSTKIFKSGRVRQK